MDIPQDTQHNPVSIDNNTNFYSGNLRDTTPSNHRLTSQAQNMQNDLPTIVQNTSQAKHLKKPHLSNLLLPTTLTTEGSQIAVDLMQTVHTDVVNRRCSIDPRLNDLHLLVRQPNGVQGASNRSVHTTSRQRRTQNKNHAKDARRNDTAKAQRRVPQAMQAQWRVGAAPSAALTLSREENQMTRVLAQATAFHTSMFEVFWGPHVRDDQYFYDIDNRVELFRDSTVTAASLIATGKTNLAQEILERVLPSMDDLLRNPHPSLYLIIAETALGLVKTPSDALQLQIVRYLSGRAHSLLGRDHPLTALLTLQISQARKEILGERLWRAVLPILIRSFGPDHYQSSTQVFCQARNMASCGRVEEAIGSIEQLIYRWSELYSANSLIVCYTKIELANILVRQGSNIKAELVVSDALRTSDMIHAAELRNEDCPASEKRHRESSIAFPRVAGFRTLGRVHSLRGNLGAATYYYSQAVMVGANSLGRSSATVELAQDELNKSRDLETRWLSEQVSIADMATNISHVIGSPVC